MPKVVRAVPIMVVAALLLAACGAGQPEASPEQRVTDRAEQRWAALIDGDFTGAYAFLSPGYRANITQRQYMGRFGGAVAWREATVAGVECDAQNACTAVITLRYLASVPGGEEYEGRRDLSERWVRSDEEWWLLPSR